MGDFNSIPKKKKKKKKERTKNLDHNFNQITLICTEFKSTIVNSIQNLLYIECSINSFNI